MSEANKDLGLVTAYGYAVAGGYTGTPEEFSEDLAAVKDKAAIATQKAEEAAESAAEAEAAATRDVPTAVNTWLANNVDPETGYVLDRTLSMSDAAAPADLVGDLKSSFDATSELENIPINPEWEIGSINGQTGENSGTTYTTRLRTNYIDVSNLKTVIITVDAGYQLVWVLLDAEKNVLYGLDQWHGSGKGEVFDRASYPTMALVRLAFRTNDNASFSDVSEASHCQIKGVTELLNTINALSGSGVPLIGEKVATSGTTFDARNMFNISAASLTGKRVKIRFECDSGICPDGLYWMSGNGKYLSGRAELYKPNQDYVVLVGAPFSASGNNYSGLYGDSSLVRGSGNIKIYFYNEFESSLDYLRFDLDSIQDFVPQSDIDLLSWGDSLTAGAGGDNTTYPSVCAAELGLTVKNCGVGGESGNTIAARQGGNNVVIPAGAINGTYSTLTDIYGTNIAPLLQGSGSNSGNKLYINGEECTLSYSNEVYTISGYTGASSLVPLLGRFAGSDFHGRIVTIWCGANGARIGSDTSVNARIAIIDSMIRHIGHDHFVVFANWTSTGTETDFADDDAAMLAHYGNKFFPVRKMLVDYGLTLMGITPTTQDETDIANGRIPTSLRSDSVHLNADGYTAVGKFLADKIRSLGYV